jgi:hypothetical protein
MTRISRISLMVGGLVFFLTMLIFIVWIFSEGNLTAEDPTPTPQAVVRVTGNG